jgi:hypothetical protein
MNGVTRKRVDLELQSAEDVRPSRGSSLAAGFQPSTCHRKVLRHAGTATTHNARHPRAADSPCLFASVPKVCGSLNVKSGDFRGEFVEGNGLKNRRRFDGKSWTRQVLISRTLSVCGGVAERLKAAVC